jgi:ABC-type transport system involved in multi-copper enzyme maturation permease subunit
MFDLIKLALFELKKMFSKKGIYVVIFFIFIVIYALIVQSKELNNTRNILPAINQLFISYILFLIAFQSTTVITEEFKFGTFSFLLTGNKSRTQILIAKFISVLFLSILIAFINFILVACYKSSVNKNILFIDFFSLVKTYIFYTFFISSFIFLFSILIKHTVSSFVSSLFCISFIGDASRALVIKLALPNYLLSFNPFCNINLSINSEILSVNQSISLFAGGIVFFILAAIIFEKQDIN